MQTLKSSFLWQMAVGFVIGALGVVALNPPAELHDAIARVVPHVHAQR